MDVGELAASAFARADRDGFRYFPGHPEIPPDADAAGVALQVAAITGRREHEAVRIAEAALLANLDADGLPCTWLADGVRYVRAVLDRTLQGGRCPASAANALLGLWRIDRGRHRQVVLRGAAALAERMAGEGPPPSHFYGPVAVDCLGLRLLAAVQRESGGALGASGDRAIGRAAGRLGARRSLKGLFGTALETALAARALHESVGLSDPGPVLRALVDAQGADGGWGADPFYATVPHPVSGHYGSRLVTTALALRALSTLPVPPSPFGAARPARGGAPVVGGP